MLSAEEEAALARAQEQARKGKSGQQVPSALRLDGIIYSHPNSWAIWLNGRFIKAHEPVEALRILKVTPEFVEMAWNPAPGQSYQIILKPNETFQNTATPAPSKEKIN